MSPLGSSWKPTTPLLAVLVCQAIIPSASAKTRFPSAPKVSGNWVASVGFPNPTDELVYIFKKKKKKLIVTTPWDALIISNKM
jgi:hypothetical protein